MALLLCGLVALLTLSGCTSVVTGDSWANLSTDGKAIYVAWKDQVFKVDPNENPNYAKDRREVLWLKKLPNNPTMYAAPTVTDDGALFIGTFNTHVVYALRAENGNQWEGWKVPAFKDKVIAPVAVNGDMVYIGTNEPGFRAYNRKTGQEYTFTGNKFGVWAKPLVIGDKVYVASLDHYLYCLKADTLEKVWAVDVGGAVADTPSYDGTGTLFIGTWDSEVISVDISGDAGKVVNRHKAKNWVWGHPVYDEGTLYFGDVSGNLTAIDAKTFEQKWTLPPDPEAAGGIRGRVAVAKNIVTLKNNAQVTTPIMIVYGTEGKKVYAVDGNGNRVWTSAPVADRILSDVIISGNSAVFTTLAEDQILVAINLSSGQRDWSVRLADAAAQFKPTSQP